MRSVTQLTRLTPTGKGLPPQLPDLSLTISFSGSLFNAHGFLEKLELVSTDVAQEGEIVSCLDYSDDGFELLVD